MGNYKTIPFSYKIKNYKKNLIDWFQKIVCNEPILKKKNYCTYIIYSFYIISKILLDLIKEFFLWALTIGFIEHVKPQVS